MAWIRVWDDTRPEERADDRITAPLAA